MIKYLTDIAKAVTFIVAAPVVGLVVTVYFIVVGSMEVVVSVLGLDE